MKKLKRLVVKTPLRNIHTRHSVTIESRETELNLLYICKEHIYTMDEFMKN